MGFGKSWVEGDGAVVTRKRLLNAVEVAKDIGSVVMGLDISVTKSQRTREIIGCFLQASKILQRVGFVIIGFRRIRPQRQRLIVVLYRFFSSAQIAQNRAAIMEGLGIIGLQFKCVPVALQRFLDATKIAEYVSAFVPDRCKSGRNCQRALDIGKSFVVTAEHPKNTAAVGECLVCFGPQLERRVDPFQRLQIAVLLGENDTEKVAGGKAGGFDTQKLAAYALGCPRVAPFVRIICLQ